MRFPLTAQLQREAREHSLRAACRDCFFWRAQRQECWHGWPDDGQRAWPPPDDEPAPAPSPDAEAVFCKEFELR